MTEHLAGFMLEGHADIALDADRLEPRAVGRKNAADVAGVGSDLAFVDELAGRAIQGIGGVGLIFTVQPKGQHGRSAVGVQTPGKGGTGVERGGEAGGNLTKERFPGLAGNALFDALE